jgi:hypothetical protein
MDVLKKEARAQIHQPENDQEAFVAAWRPD